MPLAVVLTREVICMTVFQSLFGTPVCLPFPVGCMQFCSAVRFTGIGPPHVSGMGLWNETFNKGK